jgi:hypothetical protein
MSHREYQAMTPEQQSAFVRSKLTAPVSHQTGVNEALRTAERVGLQEKIMSLGKTMARTGDAHLQGVLRETIRQTQKELEKLG